MSRSPANALLAAIVEASEDAIISKDLTGTITSWNKAAERIFGYHAQEAIGRPIFLIIPPDRIDEERSILERIERGERVNHYETVRRRKDGSMVEISLTVSPVRDENDRIIGASKIAREITERKKREELLRLTEERFRVTLASIGDAVIATDLDGRITFMNPVAEKLTGWTQQEATGMALENCFKILNEFSRQPVSNPVARVLRDGVVVGLANHTVIICRDGVERPIADSAAPIFGTRGELVGVVLVFRDVTEQRDAELTAQRFAAIVEGSDDAIIGKDLRGIVMSWNQGAGRIFGYSAEEMIGQSITRLIPADRQQEEPRILERLQRGERVDHFDTVRVTKDGRRIYVSLTISPIRDAEGHVIGASKIARDVTKRKQDEEALQETRKQLESHARELEARVQERTATLQEMVNELEAFSYSVSHDLRAPLRAMQQYAHILIEDYREKLDATAMEHLQRIVASGDRVDALIDDVLTYSRVLRAPLELHTVDLEKIVADAIHDHPPLQPPKAEIVIDSPLLPVCGFESFLRQCVSNLLTNAVKFVARDRKPVIRIWTEPRGENVRLWIADNGIGIAPEHHARIFGMFERIHSQREYAGTGIGLAIVRKAAARMGGTVGVESELGKGSKFWIELKKPDSTAPDPRRAEAIFE